jgi:alkylation response protein AidB-like acyl-CoA dehydrogenase
MQIYKAPIDDMRFILEAFGYDELVGSLPGYEAFDLETVTALLKESGKFCTNEMLPLNRKGDQEGLTYDPETSSVTLPEGFKELYAKFVESGFAGIAHPEEFGGGGGPATLALMLSEMATATNKSFSMCPGLTHGLVEALLHFGTDQQKKDYLPKLVSGEWSGTMCLTEPQCGTDLGLVSTKAIPEGDHYKLTGTKIWITFGEHDLTENIVHLVLARLPDAPPGIKGISTFLVPKFTLDGERNPVFCTGLEHKMGIHASPTCVINLEGAKGYLVGQPHKGMRAMFVMMNAARISVGLEGVALGEIAYQTALAFAKDRRQSRSLDRAKQDKDAAADNILVHPDVRRMLLNVKSTTEGMRGLAYWVGMHMDISQHHPDEATRQRSDDFVALLTPIVKSFCTERGFANVSEAMQVTGGAGYTTDWSIEQYMRDSRIAMIYEGTNHIQALDLVGRKLPQANGRLIKGFVDEIKRFIGEHKEDASLAEFLGPLKDASKTLGEVTMQLAMKGMQDPEEAAAVASNYLNLFGLTALAYIWAHQVAACIGKEGRFYRSKIKTARYFYNMILPESAGLVAIISKGKDHMMAFEVDEL